MKQLGNGRIDGFTPGKWHHLAVSLKGEVMLVTVDGKEVTRVKSEGYAKARTAWPTCHPLITPIASTISNVMP